MTNTAVKPLHTTARQFYPFVRFEQELGAPVEKALLRAGLPIVDYETSDEQIHERNVVKYMSAMSVAESYTEYMLEVSKRFPIDTLIYSSMLNGAGSGWSALAHIVRRLKEIAPTPPYWLQRDGEASWFCRGQHPIKKGIRNMELYVVDKMIDIIEGISACRLRPEAIWMQTTELGSIRSFERYSETNFILGKPCTAVAIPHKSLLSSARPFQTDPFLEKVRTCLASIHGRHLSQATPIIAESLHMSTRKFQRLLTAHQISFRVLYDEEMFQRSRAYLKDPSISINELSRHLGFTSPSNFTRSFRRITGLTPAEYRISCGDRM